MRRQLTQERLLLYDIKGHQSTLRLRPDLEP